MGEWEDEEEQRKGKKGESTGRAIEGEQTHTLEPDIFTNLNGICASYYYVTFREVFNFSLPLLHTLLKVPSPENW